MPGDVGIRGRLEVGVAGMSGMWVFVVALRFRGGVDSGRFEEPAQGKGEAESVRVAGVGRAITADLLDAAEAITHRVGMHEQHPRRGFDRRTLIEEGDEGLQQATAVRKERVVKAAGQLSPRMAVTS